MEMRYVKRDNLTLACFGSFWMCVLTVWVCRLRLI